MRGCGHTYAHKQEYKGQTEDITSGTYTRKSSRKGQVKEHTSSTYAHKEGYKDPTEKLTVQTYARKLDRNTQVEDLIGNGYEHKVPVTLTTLHVQVHTALPLCPYVTHKQSGIKGFTEGNMPFAYTLQMHRS